VPVLLWLAYDALEHQNPDEKPDVIFSDWLPLSSTRHVSLRCTCHHLLCILIRFFDDDVNELVVKEQTQIFQWIIAICQ